MIFSILKSIRIKRAAARTYRTLSALDDDALRDVGLDRRTLRAFCDTGCAPGAVAGGRTVASVPAGMPRRLMPALR